MTRTDLNIFEQLLGYSESGVDNPKTVINEQYYNDLGQYWGKYQFGSARRLDISRALNIASPTRAQFTPELQERFFAKHVELHEAQIMKELSRFIGKKVIGKNKFKKEATTNIYGLIAGAHLGGYSNLKNFLLYKEDKADSLGTYISDYVAKFSFKMEEKKKN